MENTLSSSTDKVFLYDVIGAQFDTIGSKALAVKKMLHDYFPKSDYLRRLGVCVFEAEANLAIHTIRGGSIDVMVFSDRVRITAKDDGPGMKDMKKALTPGFSTAPESARQLGFGGGVGLNNIKRFADYFYIESSKKGTTLVFEVWNDDDPTTH